MKIISHRGNIRGAIPDKENRPSYIDCAIGSGYDVEIDLRMIDEADLKDIKGKPYAICTDYPHLLN